VAGEPDLYYPGCARNFARVVPTDDQQGAVGAAFARQLGVNSAYVLHDGSVYGQGIAGVFASTATQLGLHVAGGRRAATRTRPMPAANPAAPSRSRLE
jgi:branched-chain amino acid transport system substrate-binding protein